MLSNVDLERVRRGASRLCVRGIPRGSLISAAIAAIQRDPYRAMASEYLGIKNYAHFGDQREDHQYGFCPAHGCIVFSIGRRNPRTQDPLGADEIYMLEAVRDAGTIESTKPPQHLRDQKKLNLCEALEEADAMREKVLQLDRQFAALKVDDHAADFSEPGE